MAGTSGFPSLARGGGVGELLLRRMSQILAHRVALSLRDDRIALEADHLYLALLTLNGPRRSISLAPAAPLPQAQRCRQPDGTIGTAEQFSPQWPLLI